MPRARSPRPASAVLIALSNRAPASSGSRTSAFGAVHPSSASASGELEGDAACSRWRSADGAVGGASVAALDPEDGKSTASVDDGDGVGAPLRGSGPRHAPSATANKRTGDRGRIEVHRSRSRFGVGTQRCRVPVAMRSHRKEDSGTSPSNEFRSHSSTSR